MQRTKHGASRAAHLADVGGARPGGVDRHQRVPWVQHPLPKLAGAQAGERGKGEVPHLLQGRGKQGGGMSKSCKHSFQA